MEKYIFLFLLFLGPFKFAYSSDQNVRKIFLVRHAETTLSDSPDRSLSVQGIERAKRLAFVLQDEVIPHMISSVAERACQTINPIFLDKKRTQGVSKIDFMTESIKVIHYIQTQTEGNVLVVGHSNTVPEIIEGLRGLSEGSIHIEEDDHSRFFVVHLKAGKKEGAYFEDEVANEFSDLTQLRY